MFNTLIGHTATAIVFESNDAIDAWELAQHVFGEMIGDIA